MNDLTDQIIDSKVFVMCCVVAEQIFHDELSNSGFVGKFDAGIVETGMYLSCFALFLQASSNAPCCVMLTENKSI